MAAEESKPDCVIEDSIWIRATPERVFNALTVGAEIARWWPKDAEAQPELGGKLILTWFTDHKLKTAFSTFVPAKEVSYPFYTEKLSFSLRPENDGTELKIVHHCGHDAAIHIAQSWGFLKANLKSVIEHNIDLR